MKINYKEVEVTQLEERGLFEAEFQNLSSALDDIFYAIFTVNADDTASLIYATERLDGGMIQVDDRAELKEIKRVLDCWLKHNVSKIDELYSAA